MQVKSAIQLMLITYITTLGMTSHVGAAVRVTPALPASSDSFFRPSLWLAGCGGTFSSNCDFGDWNRVSPHGNPLIDSVNRELRQGRQQDQARRQQMLERLRPTDQELRAMQERPESIEGKLASIRSLRYDCALDQLKRHMPTVPGMRPLSPFCDRADDVETGLCFGDRYQPACRDMEASLRRLHGITGARQIMNRQREAEERQRAIGDWSHDKRMERIEKGAASDAVRRGDLPAAGDHSDEAEKSRRRAEEDLIIFGGR